MFTKTLIYLCFFLVLLPLEIKSQENLILNPSCEEYSQIPNNLGGYPFCLHWWEPYIWSTDYFTSLTNNANQNYIPNNDFGYQQSLNGNFFIGIISLGWSYLNLDYIHFRHDYAGGKLSSPLIENKIYKFEFWMSKADKGILKTNAIDLIMTYDTIVDVNNYEPYGYKIWSENVPMTDTVNWVKISTCFRAKGNEKAFAIGNFHDSADVIKIIAYDTTTSGEIDYRYLDNFSLIECPTCCTDQFESEPQITIYSNPGSDFAPPYLDLWLHPNTTSTLKIFDAAGRLVEEQVYSSLLNNFTFQNFAKGMYQFVFTTSDGYVETGKVIVGE